MLEVLRVSLVAQMVKNLPAMQETGVQSLGQEDTMEKGMVFHLLILSHFFAHLPPLSRGTP